MNETREPLPLRPNVCMLVVNTGGKLFLGERRGEPGTWQFPQGGAEPELTLEENVLKELHEELGTKRRNFKILKQLEATFDYEFSKPPKYARGKWRGQSQTFWLVLFLGSDDQIELEKHDPEFMSFGWFSPNEIREKAQAKRLVGYEAGIQEFERFLSDGGLSKALND